MVFEFKLPDIGEGVHEGEIVSWLVSEGDEVAEDEPILEVMTDKATVEITSPRAGTIQTIHHQEGDVVDVGDVLVTIAESGDTEDTSPVDQGTTVESPEEAREEGAAAGPASSAEDDEEMLFSPPSEGSGGRRRRKRRQKAPAGGNGGGAQRQELVRPGGRTLATPATRKLARDLDVDIDQVPGSGERGRVLKEDVRSFAESGGRPAAAGAPKLEAPGVQTLEEDERVPVKGLRKAIFENMRRSKDYAAHFTYWEEVDVTELVKLRKDAKDVAERQGVKLTYLPFLVKATVAALKEFPKINSHMDEEAMELVHKADHHIGVAVATDRGLMVVNVRNADDKSIFQIAGEIEELAGKARNMKASREELTGSTFTITSLGRDGGLGATPVINHPETAIMGVHNIRTEPRYNDEMELEPRQVMNLSWSFDHRVIDGHEGAAFAQRIKELLETPNLLLLGTQ